MSKPFESAHLVGIVILFFVLSCERQLNPAKSQGDSNGISKARIVRSQEALAEEIVSIVHAFGKAVAREDNTDGASLVSEVDLLSSRLERISKELDQLGPFPPGLCATTRKRIEEGGGSFAKRTSQTVSRPLNSEVLRITQDAGDRFFKAWGSVNAKAGLDEALTQ